MPDEGFLNAITVFVSAPLVFTNERRQLKPFNRLDAFNAERLLISNSVRKACRDIDLRFDVLTHDRLLAAFKHRPSCMHFSGFSHPSYLVAENGSGGPSWFKLQDIMVLLRHQTKSAALDSARPFQLVFVSSPNTEIIGETFLAAGVRHVVLCRQQEEGKDPLAMAFMEHFYSSLLTGVTIQESYDQALRRVPTAHAYKFALLPQERVNHSIPAFASAGILPKCRPSLTLEARNLIEEHPSPPPPDQFVGRKVEMFLLLNLILRKRLISVVSAESRVGRSSLVCAVCHYLNERRSTSIPVERIYYVSCRLCAGRKDGFKILMDLLVTKIVESGKAPPLKAETRGTKGLVKYVYSSLKSEKCLVVLDHLECVESEDENSTIIWGPSLFLTRLFSSTINVKVLYSHCRPLRSLQASSQQDQSSDFFLPPAVVDNTLELRPLGLDDTLQLFAKKCCDNKHAPQRQIVQQLLQQTTEDQRAIRFCDTDATERSLEIFQLVGVGIPGLVIEAVKTVSLENLRALLPGGATFQP